MRSVSSDHPVAVSELMASPLQVVAVASMQRDPYVAKSVDLLSLGMMPSFSEIKGGKNILDIDLVGSKN
jgi:hypothetical protein